MIIKGTHKNLESNKLMGNIRSIYVCNIMMLLHESHLLELQIEMKFEVCDLPSFSYTAYIERRKV